MHGGTFSALAWKFQIGGRGRRQHWLTESCCRKCVSAVIAAQSSLVKLELLPEKHLQETELRRTSGWGLSHAASRANCFPTFLVSSLCSRLSVSDWACGPTTPYARRYRLWSPDEVAEYSSAQVRCFVCPRHFHEVHEVCRIVCVLLLSWSNKDHKGGVCTLPWVWTTTYNEHTAFPKYFEHNI